MEKIPSYKSRCYLPCGLEGRKRSYGMVLPYKGKKEEGHKPLFNITEYVYPFKNNERNFALGHLVKKSSA